MKKFISLLLAAVMLLSLTACGKGEKENEEEKHYSADDIAISTEHFSFTRAEVSYIFHKNYSDFKYNYPDSVDMYNIDTSASLKDQVYHDDLTWFRYFADAATEYMSQILVYCEGAYEEGIELTDEDREEIEKTVRTWTDYAKKYEYTESELFGKYFNKDVTADTLRAFLEKEGLANAYRNKVVSGFDFSDEDLSAFADKNPDQFLYVDYLKFTVDEDETDTPREYADRLAAAKTADEYLTVVNDYLVNVLDQDEADIKLDDCSVKGELKKTYSEYSDWAFGGAKAGETFTKENAVDGQYTVYMLTAEPYRDEVLTKNVRIIQENIASHKSYKETIDYLNGLIDDWKEEGGTEDGFAALAEKKSEDSETKDFGGLISAVARYDESVAEGIREWLFQEGRAIGDTGVVKGDECYYAVYFCGEEDAGWKITASIGKAQEELQSVYDGLEEKHPATVNAEVVDSLEA